MAAPKKAVVRKPVRIVLAGSATVPGLRFDDLLDSRKFFFADERLVKNPDSNDLFGRTPHFILYP